MPRPSVSKKMKQYDGAFSFSEKSNHDYYDRHLVFDHVVSVEDASQRERFEAVARTLRDLLTQRWLLTQETHDKENAKRVYYLSMEFLIGRTLVNNVILAERLIPASDVSEQISTAGYEASGQANKHLIPFERELWVTN